MDELFVAFGSGLKKARGSTANGIYLTTHYVCASKSDTINTQSTTFEQPAICKEALSYYNLTTHLADSDTQLRIVLTLKTVACRHKALFDTGLNE